MTSQHLHQILGELNQTPGRDKVIEFAYALLEWMGLAVVEGKKGQLLAPQTQKMKDYLVPAQITSQPQLYRLTADGQSIRVRFAVLKTLKKEAINQLVDNDPSLTSYQAFTKGIGKIASDAAYIPSQPYFIHFVTTASYNRLLLIFNQGDQKRLVSFRSRLTNTQYNKIILQWQGISRKPKPEIADLIWKSLDIKEVNKEFYRQVKERFDALTGIFKTGDVEASENQVKQFAVRLIGRYLFCWFLKEKEIVPHRLLCSDTIKNTDHYHQNFLQKLFFGTLNTKIQDRTWLLSEPPDTRRYFEKIPYLNGGLFDKTVEDGLFESCELNAWLITFVEVLENYDFTVDESNSQYQQVAVDPEMLGRVFENLLASQNPDTEKMANQRKAYGAFYTPREIVDYMVNESLKSHVATQLLSPLPEEKSSVNEPEVEYNGTLFQFMGPQQTRMSFDGNSGIEVERQRERLKTKIDKLFAADCSENPFDKEENMLLRKVLGAITVLDPACGSGAFPMGAMLRLFELHQIVGHGHRNNYDLKEEILSKNILGVDIMPMAVEIARLRAWLSLVLEADYKPADRKNNFGIAALPNLDFKFVCANSLIDSGYDAFLAKLDKTKGYFDVYFNLEKEIQELEQIRNEYFDPRGNKPVKAELQEKFVATKNWIKEHFGKLKENKNYDLNDFLDKIDDWNPFDDSHPSSFFSPAWMFGIKEGFDVVIGNPPYLQIQSYSGKPIQKELENQKYETFSKTGDIYCLFYERGYQLLKDGGKLVFITSNKWMRANYGEMLRQFFAANTTPLILIDFDAYEVFETATVNANIFIFSKAPGYRKKLQACTIGKGFEENTDIAGYLARNGIEINKLSSEIWVVSSHEEYRVKKRIEEKGVPLKDWDVSMYRGILTGFNEAFIIDGKKRDELIAQDPKSAEIIKPILRGRDLKRYKATFADLWLINSHNGYKDIDGVKVDRIDVEKNYPTIYQHLLQYKKTLEPRADQGEHWTNLRNCAYIAEFEKPKITWGNLAINAQFAFVEAGYYINAPSPLITPANKYILAILNSKIGDYYIRSLGVTRNGGYFEYKPMFVELAPVPQISTEKQLPFEVLVDCIIFAKDQNMDQEAKTLELALDGMVYDLFFDEEMKKQNCYITDRMTELLQPFKPDDDQDIKKEYIKNLDEFCRNDEIVFQALIQRETVKEVEIISRAKDK